VADQDLARLKIDRSKVPLRASRRKRWPWVLLVLVLLGVGWLGLRARNAAPEVETANVRLSYPAQSLTLLNATGYAVAQRKASLSSKATGRLEWLGVLEGSRVKQGEVIARLENRDVTASLQQASANVQLAQANLEQGQAELLDAERALARSRELLAQKYISAANHDIAQTRVARAKAAISGLRASIASAKANRQVAQVALDQTAIHAPFDGVILTKNANVGDNITPFSSAADSKGAVVTIADMATLEVEADVSESALAKIKLDQPCEIQLDAYPDLRLAGVVSRMVPTLDRAKATLLVKVRFVDRDARVLPDMSAKVAFLSRSLTAADKQAYLSVPTSAIVERGKQAMVFVLQGDKVQAIAVTPGRKENESVEVQGSKLKAGDKVVLKPGPGLQDGSVVRSAGADARAASAKPAA
jgi:HlyD family secretion protein